MLETQIKNLISAVEDLTAAVSRLADASPAPATTATDEKPVAGKAAKKAAEETKAEDPKPIEPPTLEAEAVRSELSAIARDGKKAELISIFKEHGAEKFADLDPSSYEDVLEKARAL